MVHTPAGAAGVAGAWFIQTVLSDVLILCAFSLSEPHSQIGLVDVPVL